MPDWTAGHLMWLILTALVSFGGGIVAACAALWAGGHAPGVAPRIAHETGRPER